MPYILPRWPQCLFPHINPINNELSGVQLQRITVPPPDIHAEPTPASTAAFDTQQELLWVGNEYVSVWPAYLTKDDAHEATIGAHYFLLWPGAAEIYLVLGAPIPSTWRRRGQAIALP